MTPLGLPVEPEVYKSIASSSGLGCMTLKSPKFIKSLKPSFPLLSKIIVGNLAGTNSARDLSQKTITESESCKTNSIIDFGNL